MAPADLNALVNRGSTLAHMGNYAGAIADFVKALEKGGRNPDIHYNLAIAYASTGKTNKAIQEFEEVLRLNPDDQQALAGLNHLRSLQGK